MTERDRTTKVQIIFNELTRLSQRLTKVIMGTTLRHPRLIINICISLLLASCAINRANEQSAAEMSLVESLKQNRKLTAAEAARRKLEIAKKYDDAFDEFDAAYWSKVIEASDRLDKKQISVEQFNVINSEANAQRSLQQKQIAAANRAAEAAEEANLTAALAARRTIRCRKYGNEVTCE